MKYVSNYALVTAILGDCPAAARALLVGRDRAYVQKRMEFARAVALMIDRGYVAACHAIWAAGYRPAFTDAAYRVSEDIADRAYCRAHDC